MLGTGRAPANIPSSLKPVRKAYGAAPRADCGPVAPKAVRRAFVEAGNCRTMVNVRGRTIVRMFRRAVSEQMIPAAVSSGRPPGRSYAPAAWVDPH